MKKLLLTLIMCAGFGALEAQASSYNITSQTIGNTTFHNGTIGGSTYNGMSQRIGNSTFHSGSVYSSPYSTYGSNGYSAPGSSFGSKPNNLWYID